MEKVINFVDYAAWVSLTLSFILICLRLWGKANYSKLEEALDRFQGKIVTFPIATPSFIFIISVCWLLA